MEYFDKVIQVEFSLKELIEIHKIIGREIDKSGVIKANDLMKIAKEIEEKTQDYLAWY